MAAPPLPSDLHAQLAVPRAAANNRLRDCVERGVELLSTRADGPEALNSLRANRRKWDDQNRELMRRLFKTDTLRLTYDRTGQVPSEAVNPGLEMQRLRDSVDDKVGLLRAILDQLDQNVDTGPADKVGGGGPTAANAERPRIFVAHSGDARLARTVARFLDVLGVSPVVVGDSPGEGEIGYDQIAAYQDTRFAVILIAGDQIGTSAQSEQASVRMAQPGALLLLGYLAGRLGPARVCGLHQPGIDSPGSALRIHSVEFDDGGTWKRKLPQRLSAAGLAIRLPT